MFSLKIFFQFERLYLTLLVSSWLRRRIWCVIRIWTRITLSWRRWWKTDFTIIRIVLKRQIWTIWKFFSLFDFVTLPLLFVDSVGIRFSRLNAVGIGNVSIGFGWFIFISLRRRLTFCESTCSSIFGVRFRRILSVVGSFFVDWLLVEPKTRNGELGGMAWKSRVSKSVATGLTMSCWEKFYRNSKTITSWWWKLKQNERVVTEDCVALASVDYYYQLTHFVEEII